MIIVTKPVAGVAANTETKVETEDKKRRYLGLYAQSGGCVVSLGALANHSANAMTIAEGNLLEVDAGSQVNWTATNGQVLLILTDRNSKHLLMSDSCALTYDGNDMYYENHNRDLAAPVFS